VIYRLFVVLVLTISSVGLASAQQLFKIITYSDGVKLDGKAVKPGQIVTAKSISLVIPGNGYVGVINKDGWLLELKKSMKVNAVNAFVASKFANEAQPVSRDGWELKFPMAPPHAKSSIYGDTLFLYWLNWNHHEFEVPSNIMFTLKIENQFLEVIDSVATKNNWAKLNVKNILDKQPSVIIEASGSNPRQSSEKHQMKRDTTQLSKIDHDLKGIPPSADQLFYETAIYQLNDLAYDQQYVLHKIARCREVPADKFLGMYYRKLYAKYRWDLVRW
jgi:hypothetical protein